MGMITSCNNISEQLTYCERRPRRVREGSAKNLANLRRKQKRDARVENQCYSREVAQSASLWISDLI